MGGSRSRWATVCAALVVGWLVTAAMAPGVQADPLPLSYQVTADANDTAGTLEAAAFQWCGTYPLEGCGALETTTDTSQPTYVSMSVQCIMSSCFGPASAGVGQMGWYYHAGPGIVMTSVQNHVSGESITLDGIMVGLGFIFPGNCFILPRNWSLFYVHHITIELHSDGAFKVTVPDAKEPATDPGFGKHCQRPDLLTASATWSGHAPPGSFTIP